MLTPARRSSAPPPSTSCRPIISTTPRKKSSRPSREPEPMAEDHLAAPSPLEEHRKLAAFAGEWSGEEMVYPSRWTQGGPATSRVSARMALNGFYLIQGSVQMRDRNE